MPDQASVSEMVRRRGAARAMDDVRGSTPASRWPMGIGSIEAQARIAAAGDDIDLLQTLLDIIQICEITRGAA